MFHVPISGSSVTLWMLLDNPMWLEVADGREDLSAPDDCSSKRVILENDGLSSNALFQEDWIISSSPWRTASFLGYGGLAWYSSHEISTDGIKTPLSLTKNILSNQGIAFARPRNTSHCQNLNTAHSKSVNIRFLRWVRSITHEFGCLPSKRVYIAAFFECHLARVTITTELTVRCRGLVGYFGSELALSKVSDKTLFLIVDEDISSLTQTHRSSTSRRKLSWTHLPSDRHAKYLPGVSTSCPPQYHTWIAGTRVHRPLSDARSNPVSFAYPTQSASDNLKHSRVEWTG